MTGSQPGRHREEERSEGRVGCSRGAEGLCLPKREREGLGVAAVKNTRGWRVGGRGFVSCCGRKLTFWSLEE